MTIEQIIGKLPHIDTNRRYWLLRTDGGTNYTPFLTGKFIAIDYNKISLEDVSISKKGDYAGLEALALRVSKAYGDNESRPKHAANQLYKFVYEMKKGDIVMIPSVGSWNIQFAEITDTVVFNEYENRFDCNLIKRKHIKLLKNISRERLDPNIYKVFFSHHTITEADQYAEYIDKIINQTFIKGDKGHLVLDVQTLQDVKARSLFKTGDVAMDLLDEFCEEAGIQYDSSDFEVKLAVQSPGFIEFVGSPGGITLLGILIVAIAGGGFKISVPSKWDAELKTDGIIEKLGVFITKVKNNSLKTALLKKHSENLQIKDPEELTKVIKQLDNDNKTNT